VTFIVVRSTAQRGALTQRPGKRSRLTLTRRRCADGDLCSVWTARTHYRPIDI